MFKTKSHHAYIIMMINKESYIKKKSHKDSIKNPYDSRRLQYIEKFIFLCYNNKKCSELIQWNIS